MIADAFHTIADVAVVAAVAVCGAFLIALRVCVCAFFCLSASRSPSSFMLTYCCCFIFNIRRRYCTFRGIMFVSHFLFLLLAAATAVAVVVDVFLFSLILFHFYVCRSWCRCSVYTQFLVLFHFICALISARYARAAKR